jgi:hypothetical protein
VGQKKVDPRSIRHLQGPCTLYGCTILYSRKADTFMRTVRILSLRTTHPDNYQKAIIKALPHVDDTWAPKLPHSQRDSEMPKLTLEETQERERKAHRENSRLHLETTRFQLPIH